MANTYLLETHLNTLDNDYDNFRKRAVTTKKANKEATSFPKRDVALENLGPHKILEEHDDGDLTVESEGKKYVVTTNGDVFEEVDVEEGTNALQKADLPISTKAIITNKDGKVLCLKDRWAKFWDLPGGHVDSEETPVEGLIREVREETGLTVDDVEELDLSGDVKIGSDNHPVLFYRVVASGTLKVDPEEHTKYVWVDEDNLDDFNLGAFKDVVEDEIQSDDFLEKAKVAYHEHDGWAEHPVAVKDHQKYFAGVLGATSKPKASPINEYTFPFRLTEGEINDVLASLDFSRPEAREHYRKTKDILGDNLILEKNPTLPSDSQAIGVHLDHLNRIPPKFLMAAKNAGIRISLSGQSVPNMDKKQDLLEVTPRGWPAGSTWDNVAGCYDLVKKIVFAGKGLSGSVSLALHEFSHAMDAVFGLNNMTIFKNAHARLQNKLDPYQADYVVEFVAESIAMFFSVGKMDVAWTYDNQFADDLEHLLLSL